MKLTIPDYLSAIKPYVPGKPIEEVQREYGIDHSIKLASNENPFGPSPMALAAIQQVLGNLLREQVSIRDLRSILQALAEWGQVENDTVMLTEYVRNHDISELVVAMDERRDRVMPILRKTYGDDQADIWWVRWRLFFMACAELFYYREGGEWGVSHYLFEPH